MKKTYMTPSQKIASLDMESMIAQSSSDAAIANFEAVGNAYDSEAESYAKGDKSSLWDNLW